MKIITAFAFTALSTLTSLSWAADSVEKPKVEQPKEQACKPPEYPAASIQNREEGVTEVSLLIATDGHVKQTKLIKSSGYKVLDDNARAALALCHFTPASEDGFPVESWGKMAYTWSVPKAPAAS